MKKDKKIDALKHVKNNDRKNRNIIMDDSIEKNNSNKFDLIVTEVQNEEICNILDYNHWHFQCSLNSNYIIFTRVA